MQAISKNCDGDARFHCRLAWLGPVDREFAWLTDRVARCTSDLVRCDEARRSATSINATGIDIVRLREIGESEFDRVIVACRNRWDYPLEALQEFAAERPDLPIAVALSDWWQGWRRTGVGHLRSMPHLSLPWYRWWDGWMAWLEGSSPAMFGPFPRELPGFLTEVASSTFSSQSDPFDGDPSDRTRGASGESNFPPQRGLVLAACQPDAEIWQRVLGQTCDVRLSCGVTTELGASGTDLRPDWILWDDSRLTTCIDWESSMESATAELLRLAQQFPTASLWLALTQPSWDQIQRFRRAGLVFEFLGKPFYGIFSSAALCRT